MLNKQTNFLDEALHVGYEEIFISFFAEGEKKYLLKKKFNI